MFPWKSNSEKFFKCFQHISMKHRPSWNHLDLKQMHWLFSQQAFLLGAETGTGARGGGGRGKVFSPLPRSATAWDSINTRVSRRGSSGKIMKMRWVTEFPYRICSFSHLQSHRPRTELEHHQGAHQNGTVGQGVKGVRHHGRREPGHCFCTCYSRQEEASPRAAPGWAPRVNGKTNAEPLLQGLARCRGPVIGSWDFQYLFITVNTITPPGFTFLPQTGTIHVNSIHKVSTLQSKPWDGR